MKTIFLSIQSSWACKIFNKLKNVEIRGTEPKVELPCRIVFYCTKNSDSMFFEDEYYFTASNRSNAFLNGKVLGECLLTKVENIFECGVPGEVETCTSSISQDALIIRSFIDTLDYLRGKKAWHLENVVAYDVPKSLSDFGLTIAPQSWRYVES